MYRATVDGQEIRVNISSDGCIWTWKLGRGQSILANSEDAYQWALAHCHVDDLPHIVRRLKPSLTVHHYMQSHLAG